MRGGGADSSSIVAERGGSGEVVEKEKKEGVVGLRRRRRERLRLKRSLECGECGAALFLWSVVSLCVVLGYGLFGAEIDVACEVCAADV